MDDFNFQNTTAFLIFKTRNFGTVTEWICVLNKLSFCSAAYPDFFCLRRDTFLKKIKNDYLAKKCVCVCVCVCAFVGIEPFTNGFSPWYNDSTSRRIGKNQRATWRNWEVKNNSRLQRLPKILWMVDWSKSFSQCWRESLLTVNLFDTATIKGKDQITNLESLQNSKATKSKEEMAEPSVMFNRLITVATREDDLQPIFEFELTYEPMPLFKNGIVRKPDKTSFWKVIMYDDAVRKEDIKNPDNYVLDGGSLLHRVRWFKGMKFNAEVYPDYIRKNHRGCVTVVFNGYRDEGTNSHEHVRRNSIPQSCNVDIHEENPVPFTQDRVLSNTENKANFINFLS